MPSRFSFIICVTAAVLFLAACSTSTVVSSDDRVTQPAGQTTPSADDEPEDDEPDDLSDDEPADDAADDDPDDPDPDDDDPDDPDEPASAAELEAIEGFGLGGAEQLESLLVDCREGSDLACDVMFQLSGFDTIEETTALTCGGRSNVEVLFCTPGIDAAPGELVFDTESEGLPAIVSRCEINGDMTACDFLYFRSPIESTFEKIGESCGGRVKVAVPDCRTFLAE